MRVIILKDYNSRSGINFLKGQEVNIDFTTALELSEKKIIKNNMAPKIENAMQIPDPEIREKKSHSDKMIDIMNDEKKVIKTNKK